MKTNGWHTQSSTKSSARAIASVSVQLVHENSISMEYPPPFNLKFTNSLSVLLRVVHKARKFITNVLPYKFRNSSDLELLIRQEQRTFSSSLIGHLEQLKEPLAKDKPLINRLNLIYQRGRNVLVAETRIHDGERLRELIYVPPSLNSSP